MDFGAEKLVRRSMVQIILARLVVIFFSFLATIFNLIASVFKVAGGFFEAVGAALNLVSNTFFTVELDGARRYEQLTGVRLGAALGVPGRYTDLHAPDSGHPVTFKTEEQ